MTALIKTLIESASYFGNNIFLATIVIGALLSYLVISGFYKAAFFMALSVLSLIWSVLIKNIFKVPRLDTYVGDPSRWGDMYRFPSSHVIFYVCFWGFLLFLTTKKEIFGEGAAMHLIRFVGLFHILLVGISRVVIGAHTLQDVIVGYVLGFLYLGLLIYLYR